MDHIFLFLCVPCKFLLKLTFKYYNAVTLKIRSLNFSLSMAAFMIISYCRVCVCVCVYYTYVCVLVAQSCSTLCDSMDCSPSSSSVHGILQARILEWESIPSSRASSRPRDRTQTDSLPSEPPGKPNLLQKCLL